MANPLTRAAAFEAAQTWLGRRTADADLVEVPADHPCRTAPLTSRYVDPARSGFLGVVEDPAAEREWVGFVTPIGGFAVFWLDRSPAVLAAPPMRFTWLGRATREDGEPSDPADPGDGEDDGPDSEESPTTPISIMTFRDLEIHIDGHVGDVVKGTDFEGKPYEVRRSCPYGFLPATKGDDGEGYDCYVLPKHDADDVYVLTQLKARSQHFDEQKAVLGADSAAQAEQTLNEHIHARMFGRMGHVSYADFKRQVDDHRKALADGSTAPLRIVTDEDAAEARSMKALADHLAL